MTKQKGEREEGAGTRRLHSVLDTFSCRTKRYPVSVSIALGDVKFLNMRNRLAISQQDILKAVLHNSWRFVWQHLSQLYLLFGPFAVLHDSLPDTW